MDRTSLDDRPMERGVIFRVCAVLKPSSHGALDGRHASIYRQDLTRDMLARVGGEQKRRAL